MTDNARQTVGRTYSSTPAQRRTGVFQQRFPHSSSRHVCGTLSAQGLPVLDRAGLEAAVRQLNGQVMPMIAPRPSLNIREVSCIDGPADGLGVPPIICDGASLTIPTQRCATPMLDGQMTYAQWDSERQRIMELLAAARSGSWVGLLLNLGMAIRLDGDTPAGDTVARAVAAWGDAGRLVNRHQVQSAVAALAEGEAALESHVF